MLKDEMYVSLHKNLHSEHLIPPVSLRSPLRSLARILFSLELTSYASLVFLSQEVHSQMFAWELYLLQRVRPWNEGCEPPMLCLLMIRRDSMQHLSQALKAVLVKKAKCQGRKDLEWRTLVLVGNESALLPRVRQVKIVLLGQFTFRADCVWE